MGIHQTLHYLTTTKCNSTDEITEQSLQTLTDNVKMKASREQSKYVAYLKLNPTLTKPDIHTYKAHNTA